MYKIFKAAILLLLSDINLFFINPCHSPRDSIMAFQRPEMDTYRVSLVSARNQRRRIFLCILEESIMSCNKDKPKKLNRHVPVFWSVERVEMLISCRSSNVSVWKRRMEEPSENAIHTPPPAHAMCATLTSGSGWTSNFCQTNRYFCYNNMWRKCNHPFHQ